jgi:hypothetical protein
MVITIVSGLPRSGTSLMMQMLAAGGIPILADSERKADSFNPNGYFEWEQINLLPANPGLIARAEGKVVKIFSPLLAFLPAGFEYRIIFMQRSLREVLKSQQEMLRCLSKGDSASALPGIQESFARHLTEVVPWLAQQANMIVAPIDYHRVLREPSAVAEDLAFFLNRPLDIEGMSRQVDPALYRTREAA